MPWGMLTVVEKVAPHRFPLPLARRRQLVHDVDEGLDVFEWSLLVDAVAEIEDVARAARGALENGRGGAADLRRAREQHSGVEIALHGHVEAEPLPGRTQVDAPIETDDVAPGFLHHRQERGRAHAEVDDGHVRI